MFPVVPEWCWMVYSVFSVFFIELGKLFFGDEADINFTIFWGSGFPWGSLHSQKHYLDFYPVYGWVMLD